MAQLADGVLQALCVGDPKRLILFAPENANVFDSAAWPRVSDCCLVIDEVSVSADSLPAIMEYYWSVTDLPICPVDRAAIQRHLLTNGFDKKYSTLGEFFQAVDRTMLLHYEANSGKCARPRSENDAVLERSNILRPLRRLLEGGAGAVEGLVQGIEVKLRQRLLGVDEVLAEMYEVARNLLEEVRGARADAPATEIWLSHRKLLWTVGVLIGLPRMADDVEALHEKLADQPETFLAQFDFFCRDLQRRLISDADNPFPDWWLELNDVLNRFANYSDAQWPSAEDRVLSALSECLAQARAKAFNAPWARRLAAIVGLAVDARSRRLSAPEGFV